MSFRDDLSQYGLDECFPEGSSFGPWTTVFHGFGCVSISDVNGTRRLRLRPKSATSAGDTHACLVAGPHFSGSMKFEAGVVTLEQLRKNDPPNAWEMAWVIWNYTDPEHFYYFILKPNGWELGKRDPGGQGGQKFLATGEHPTTPIVHRREVRVEQDGPHIRVLVDGGIVVDFTDHNAPYLEGRIGLYCEDSDVLFDSISAAGPG